IMKLQLPNSGLEGRILKRPGDRMKWDNMIWYMLTCVGRGKVWHFLCLCHSHLGGKRCFHGYCSQSIFVCVAICSIILKEET
uniref:Uncharacterized protein n=1 Tax=Monopterus albus TaxID=43700 RepID=A0A3Q3JKN9_MONAL